MSYPKEIAETSRGILNARRERAELALNERRVRISRLAPHILQLEREMASTSARIAGAVLSGENVQQKLARIREFNLTKQQELKEALTAAGFSIDALEIQYSCPICKDTGNDNGKLCECARQLQKGLMYERLGAVSSLSDSTFENFSLHFYSDTSAEGSPVSERAIMKKTLLECTKYATSFSPSAPSLLMIGAPGLGKTHLSIAIACAAIEKGYDVMYVPFHTLLTKLEAARFGKSSEEFQDYLSPALNCDLLVLDDLGSEFSTSFSTAVLYDIINTRQLQGAPTIINTNLKQSELSIRYSERIRSRLLGCYRIIPFEGSDIRLQKKQL
ncbi:MAG TPA: ATP-binding protein [Clostridia bacterium]|nr:ATP-binding protein [Clostridia bacterium]